MEQEGRWMARLNRARTGLQGHCSGEAEDDATDRDHCPLRDVAPKSMAGSPDTHLSLPFWMEAWPRLALSKSGEFLLRFVLVERMLFVEGVGVVFFLSRPGRGLAGTLAVLLAFRPVSSSGRLFSALLL